MNHQERGGASKQLTKLGTEQPRTAAEALPPAPAPSCPRKADVVGGGSWPAAGHKQASSATAMTAILAVAPSVQPHETIPECSFTKHFPQAASLVRVAMMDGLHAVRKGKQHKQTDNSNQAFGLNLPRQMKYESF